MHLKSLIDSANGDALKELIPMYVKTAAQENSEDIHKIMVKVKKIADDGTIEEDIKELLNACQDTLNRANIAVQRLKVQVTEAEHYNQKREPA